MKDFTPPPFKEFIEALKRNNTTEVVEPYLSLDKVTGQIPVHELNLDYSSYKVCDFDMSDKKYQEEVAENIKKFCAEQDYGYLLMADVVYEKTVSNHEGRAISFLNDFRAFQKSLFYKNIELKFMLVPVAIKHEVIRDILYSMNMLGLAHTYEKDNTTLSWGGVRYYFYSDIINIRNIALVILKKDIKAKIGVIKLSSDKKEN